MNLSLPRISLSRTDDSARLDPRLRIAIPVATGTVGVLLLMLGGLASLLGAWVLIAGLPIAIGALDRDPRLILAPAGVWLGWMLIVAFTGPGSGVPQTPAFLSLLFGAASVAFTWVAQRAILPATDAWDTSSARTTSARSMPTPRKEELAAALQHVAALDQELSRLGDSAFDELDGVELLDELHLDADVTGATAEFDAADIAAIGADDQLPEPDVEILQAVAAVEAVAVEPAPVTGPEPAGKPDPVAEAEPTPEPSQDCAEATATVDAALGQLAIEREPDQDEARGYAVEFPALTAEDFAALDDASISTTARDERGSADDEAVASGDWAGRAARAPLPPATQAAQRDRR